MPRRAKSRPRTAKSYIAAAKKLSALAPSLKKYTTKEFQAQARKGIIPAAAKAAIARKEKLLRHTENLHPLTKKQYKAAKKLGITAGNGLQAMRLRNTEDKARIRVTKDGLKVGTNGRTITYVVVEPPELESIIAAAAEAFGGEYETYEGDDENPEEIDVTNDGDYNVTVWLWTIAGRASRGFRSLALFIEDISKAFQAYTNQLDWIRGIAWLREKS